MHLLVIRDIIGILNDITEVVNEYIKERRTLKEIVVGPPKEFQKVTRRCLKCVQKIAFLANYETSLYTRQIAHVHKVCGVK